MTRFVVDREAFFALLRQDPLRVGRDEIVLSPTVGWTAMLEAILAAIKAGVPASVPTLALRPLGNDPPEAREMLATYRPPRKP